MKVLGLLILAAIALYFYPTICAAGEHPRSAGIFALNLLAGWTFVGGVALLSGRSTPVEFARANGIPEAPYRDPAAAEK
jgi:hypothetical protein